MKRYRWSLLVGTSTLVSIVAGAAMSACSTTGEPDGREVVALPPSVTGIDALDAGGVLDGCAWGGCMPDGAPADALPSLPNITYDASGFLVDGATTGPYPDAGAALDSAASGSTGPSDASSPMSELEEASHDPASAQARLHRLVVAAIDALDPGKTSAARAIVWAFESRPEQQRLDATGYVGSVRVVEVEIDLRSGSARLRRFSPATGGVLAERKQSSATFPATPHVRPGGEMSSDDAAVMMSLVNAIVREAGVGASGCNGQLAFLANSVATMSAMRNGCSTPVLANMAVWAFVFSFTVAVDQCGSYGCSVYPSYLYLLAGALNDVTAASGTCCGAGFAQGTSATGWCGALAGQLSWLNGRVNAIVDAVNKACGSSLAYNALPR